jgi:hypothetical protein
MPRTSFSLCVSACMPYLFQTTRQRLFDTRGLRRHGTVRERRLTPIRSRRVDPGPIPYDGVLVLLPKGVREDAAVIPELRNAPVADQRESSVRRPPPIGEEHWLPDHEHSQVAIHMPLQNRCHCGGPPQTCRSSGREQHHQTSRGRSLELAFEIIQPEFGQRRLTRGCGPWPGNLPPKGGSNRQHHQAGQQELYAPRPAHNFASHPARSCGNSMDIPTNTADVQSKMI